MVRIQQAGKSPVWLAQLEPSDRESLRRFFYRLSPETLYRRFMRPVSRPGQVRPDRLLDVDHWDREAIVAVDDGEIVGVARYVRQAGAGEAELAVVVADDWQRQGHASRMLATLAERAAAACINRFTMSMLADNGPILRLVRRADPSARFALSHGVYETTVPVSAFQTIAIGPPDGHPTGGTNQHPEQPLHPCPGLATKPPAETPRRDGTARR